jgi:anaerobic selenocysteine-containing dehydrogenase
LAIERPARRERDRVPTSAPVADEIKTTTCYMCACRCGVRVHLKDGHIRYIDGNPDHPINRGVLCAKGSAGIMQQASPAKLTKPLLRTGPRGSGEFREIEWEEALELAAGWLAQIRADDPRRLAFFTGRDQSQALTGWWAQQFGTPNYAAHGGFCSVNMAAAGLYTVGGSFWEFGEPDWDLCRYLMLFGVAEDHDSNPIKIGLGRLKARGAKIVSINPVRTGYSAIADEWIGIRPGTDGLLVLAIAQELLRADRIDLDYLSRWTNAPWLVRDDPGGSSDGLFARGAGGRPLVLDAPSGRPASVLDPQARPRLVGQVTLDDGGRARPVFELMARRLLDPAYAPDRVAAVTGIDAGVIRRLAAELAEAAFADEMVLDRPWTDWAGRRHDRMVARPVAMHAMRGVSAHSNGFQTARALHLLQMLLGAVDAPGSWCFEAPFPRAIPPSPKPCGKAHEVMPGQPMPGLALGFPHGPEDLLVDEAGEALRIDKAYSWEAPLAVHGLMHMVIRNAWKGDPYPIDTLFLYMANMAWNSAMNVPGTLAMLTDRDPATGDYRIPHIIYVDAYRSETVAYADLVLPDTTYLERWDCISLLDRPISSADGPADAIRRPVLTPDRDVRPFQDVLIDLGHRLGLPGLTRADGGPRYPGFYPDYMVNHERKPGIGLLAGWRGSGGTEHGSGEANPRQLERYIENGGFWRHALAPEQRYFRHVNRDYLEWAAAMGFRDSAEPIFLQVYSEPLQRFRLAARGHGPVRPPEHLRARIAEHFDPLPFWSPPASDSAADDQDLPLHAVTQRPMAMYHSWGSHNAWLRQIHGWNSLYIHRLTAQRLGIADGDWVWIENRLGRVKGQAKLMDGVNPRTVWTWNAVGKRAGAWALDARAPEATLGFLLNHIIPDLSPESGSDRPLGNADPITGQAAWYDLRVRVRKVEAGEADGPEPRFPALDPGSATARPPVLRYGARFRFGRGEPV